MEDECGRAAAEALGRTPALRRSRSMTNREIAAGGMALDDPIPQVAVTAAASPHLSHAELLARAAAKERSDVSIESLVNELKSACAATKMTRAVTRASRAKFSLATMMLRSPWAGVTLQNPIKTS
jgi:KaiC/GvpD/RAD55 family RecA-like ATPase